MKKQIKVKRYGKVEGGKKAAKTVKERYGEDHYRRMGHKGGLARVPKGFAINRELAAEAGTKGGRLGAPGLLDCNHVDEEFYQEGRWYARCQKCKSVRRVR